MVARRHLLTDFLNHGVMPFVGRGHLLDQLHAFWKSTFDAEGLRLFCLVAEAGCGKSRLLEELLPAIRRDGGSILHLRLLPESSTSLAVPMVTALRHDRVGRALLADDQNDNLFDVIPAVRSLVRIRPVLIVVEDVHLLPELSGGDLHALITSFRDESVSLLCVSRRVEGLEQILAPGLTDIVELAGLAPDAIGHLWRELFGAEPEGDVVDMLAETTAGNPLALRAVLRGAVVAGLIDPDTPGTCVRPVCSPGEFLSFVHRTLADIGEGMTAGLLPDEQAGAGHLALLGEAFARETAEVLLADNTELLDRLVFRGVLRPTFSPPRPLSDASREYPSYPKSHQPVLTFAHSVLHRYFLGKADTDLPVLQTILASDLPLYSVLPVRIHLESLPDPARYSPERGRALLRSLMILYDQALSTEWVQAAELAGALREALEKLESESDGNDVLCDLEITSLFMEAVLADLQGDTTRAYRNLKLAYHRTEKPESLITARLRIAALIKDPEQDWADAEARRAGMRELHVLGADYPELRTGPDYARCVCALGIYAVEDGDFGMFDEVERYYEETIGQIDDAVRREYLDLWFLPLLSQVFRSPQEAAIRKEQVRQLRSLSAAGPYDTHVAEHLMAFFFETGDWNSLLRTVRESREILRMKQMNELVVRGYARELYALAAQGVSRAELERRAGEVLRDEHLNRDYACELLGRMVPEALWMRGDEDWHVPLVEGLALSSGVCPFLLPGVPAPSRAEVAGRLKIEPLRIGDVLALSAGIDFYGDDQAALPEADVIMALERSFAWLQAVASLPFLRALTERHAGHVPPAIRKQWKSVVEELQRVASGGPDVAGDDQRLLLSLIDGIRVRYPSGEWRKVTGGKMKTVLGLMVANRMFDQNLSLEEFALFAAGDELADAEAARNNLYVRLHSLRSLLGKDAILSETGQAPELNPAYVRVDLLEAAGLLRDAGRHVGRNVPGKGLYAVQRAFDLLNGGIPFPGLYDDLFEAARSDFEVLVRDTVLMVARELVRLGDPENTAEVLEQALGLLPGDEEVAGYLCEILGTLGRKSHAERLRRRTLRFNTLDPES